MFGENEEKRRIMKYQLVSQQHQLDIFEWQLLRNLEE